MNGVVASGHRVGLSADMQSSTTYITATHLGEPTTPLLRAFNLRIAAYLLTLTLAGAVTHSPPPILAAADGDVEENIVLQILQFLFGKFFVEYHQTDDSRQ